MTGVEPLDFSKKEVPAIEKLTTNGMHDTDNRYRKVGVPQQAGRPSKSALSMLLGTTRELQDSRRRIVSMGEDASVKTVSEDPSADHEGAGASSKLSSSHGSVVWQPVTEEIASVDGSRSSSIVSSPAGSGFMNRAGEIGTVTTPHRYSASLRGDRPASVDPRFVVNLPRTPSSTSTSSIFLGRSLSKMSMSWSSNKAQSSSLSSSHASTTSIKRFLKKPWKGSDALSPEQSPTFSADSRVGSPYTGISFSARPMFGDDSHRCSLARTYGKLGKKLGEGAGGNVKIVRSNKDGQIYAVKEFRQRKSNESQREYSKKVSAEYCLGLTLKHPHVVNTIDIVYEADKVYQIMEYCEYDLFAVVMSGRMKQEEVYCDFRQLMSGLLYLHKSGLAHRDLKLDNIVVTAAGIVKLIDFGSSVIFRYPESDKIYDAQGVVGSDPYIAPEALNQDSYDPCATDIWSAAIILCCMLLKKFPWKIPKLSDNSFKHFATEENGRRPGFEQFLQTLPEDCRPLIGHMLELDAVRRWTISQCWDDAWLKAHPYCTLIDGHTTQAPNHVHTTVAFEDAHIAQLERRNRRAKKTEKMW